MNDIYTGLIR